MNNKSRFINKSEDKNKNKNSKIEQDTLNVKNNKNLDKIQNQMQNDDANSTIYKPLKDFENQTSQMDVVEMIHSVVDQGLDAHSNYKSKVKGKALLIDNPPASHKLRMTRINKRKQASYKRKNKPLNSKQRKELFSTTEDLKYEMVKDLKTLWIEYIDDVLGIDKKAKDLNEKKPTVDEIDEERKQTNKKSKKGDDSNHNNNNNNNNNKNTIGNVNKATILSKLLKCDFHGAEVKVIKSKNPTLIGIKGILLKETENMFELIDVDNVVRKIPKANSVFEIDLHGNPMHLFGTHMQIRSADRSSRKFKTKSTIDL